MEQIGNPAQRNEVKLHVLPRCEMPFAPAKLIGDHRELSKLGGRQNPAGDLGAHHVDTGLALSINSPAQTVLAKLIIGELAPGKAFGFVPEVFDILADNPFIFRVGLF
jgi:hypothetical protein